MRDSIIEMEVALRDSLGRFTPGHQEPIEYRHKKSANMKGRRHLPNRKPRPKGLKYNISPEGRVNMERGLKLGWGWNKGISPTVEQKGKISKSVRKAAQEGRCKPPLPTSLEKWIQEILDRHFPGEWAYIGDGKITIEGYIPDFINVNGKKLIIEAFGVYWHSKEQEEQRIAIFSRYGFRTLIIWERNSNNPKKRLPLEEEIVDAVRGFLCQY